MRLRLGKPRGEFPGSGGPRGDGAYGAHPVSLDPAGPADTRLSL